MYTHTQWNTVLSKKKNEMLPFAATWMDLECIMLSEMSDRKHKYCIILLSYVS